MVIEEAGVKSRTRIDGVSHSELMYITKRIWLLDDDILEIEFIIDDPKAFLKPWIITRQYKDYDTMNLPITDYGINLNHERTYMKPTEVVCNENNRDIA